MEAKNPIEPIAMHMCDMPSDEQIRISNIFMDWKLRSAGVIHKGINDKSLMFECLMKDKSGTFVQKSPRRPTFPSEFKVPPLKELYLCKDIREIKWTIFGFISSISDEKITAIKRLPKKYLLTSTTLYTLVKEEFLTEKQADGILYTEYKAIDAKLEYPKKLSVEHVRVAHIYNNTFPRVKKCFIIAGLNVSVQGLSQFDGVYFQKTMEKVDLMNPHEYKRFIAPIRKYRIYDRI